jgi:hypothetical protein
MGKDKDLGGRPTKYKAEYAKQAGRLCALGATDADLAEFFEVTESTINLWKIEHSKFSESMLEAKQNHDFEVEQALARRAKGFMKVKQVFNPEGNIVMLQEEVPPDTNACSLWLRNRQPQKWRDKQEHEVTGKDGEPFIPVLNITLKK